MRFKNSYELARYFVEECTDCRRWGILQNFWFSNSWKYYFRDMQDKYVRGKPVTEHMFAPEYHQAEIRVISDFIDYIDKRLTFPLEYVCKCVDADGYSTYFKVDYIEDNQLSFDMSMV